MYFMRDEVGQGMDTKQQDMNVFMRDEVGSGHALDTKKRDINVFIQDECPKHALNPENRKTKRSSK